MTNGHKHTRGDSFKQKKGDIYQFAYAVKICLEAKEGERIQIEHKGDISSDTLYSYEIKQYESNFTFQTNQFWNTLYNWITDLNVYRSFSHLVLLTTSDAEDKDLVKEWNSSSKEQKYDTLKKIKPTIESRKNVSKDKIKYLNKIFSFNNNYSKNELLEILEKINVVINATSAREIKADIMNLECFKYDSDVVKKRLISEAYRFILDVGLTKNEWVIETCELHKKLRDLKTENKYNLKKVDELDDVRKEDYKAYNFVKEIKAIKLKGEIIDEAIQDYYISNEQIKDIIDEFPGVNDYISSLELFSKELLRNLKNIKNQSSLMQTKNNEQYNYFQSFKIGLKSIDIIENNDDFQRGNIHKIVDEGRHNWKIDEDE